MRKMVIAYCFLIILRLALCLLDSYHNFAVSSGVNKDVTNG